MCFTINLETLQKSNLRFNQHKSYFIKLNLLNTKLTCRRNLKLRSIRLMKHYRILHQNVNNNQKLP